MQIKIVEEKMHGYLVFPVLEDAEYELVGEQGEHAEDEQVDRAEIHVELFFLRTPKVRIWMLKELSWPVGIAKAGIGMEGCCCV